MKKVIISLILIVQFLPAHSVQSYEINGNPSNTCMYYKADNNFMVGTKAFPKGCIIKLCTDNTIVIDGNWYLSNDPIIYQNGSLKYAFTTDFMGDAEFIINYNNQNKTATAILRMKYDISQRAKIYLREIKETEVVVKDKDSDNKAQSKLDGYGFESIEMLDTNDALNKAFNELIQMTNAMEEIKQKLEANPTDEKAINELIQILDVINELKLKVEEKSKKQP